MQASRGVVDIFTTKKQRENSIPFEDEADGSDSKESDASISSATVDLRQEKDELIGIVTASILTARDFKVVLEPLTNSEESSRLKKPPAVRIAGLVHTICAKDAEFVLKLALYVRRNLNIRTTANFITALCACEPNCYPFLHCYMVQIICLPTDWLDVANTTYHFQEWYAGFCAETDSYGSATLVDPHQHQHEQQQQQQQEQKAHISGRNTKRRRSHFDERLHELEEYIGLNDMPGGKEKVVKQNQQNAQEDHDHRRGLPNALRQALVATFDKFTEFSLAKHNTERSEKRIRSKLKDNDKEKKSFTMKELIRRLHISHRPYTIFCLLGKRYPDTEEKFISLGLDEGGVRAFDAGMRGRRMRLPIPESWETMVSAHGNVGPVWDKLVLGKKLPFMATLRNLRNIVSAECSPETYVAINRRLRSEEEVAASKQFPYRFLSAYNALKSFELMDSEGNTAQRSSHISEFMTSLEQAVNISTRLNLPPIQGTSLVLVNISHELLYTLSKESGGYSDPVLLVAAFRFACEDCKIVYFCGTQCREVDWDFRREGGLLKSISRLRREFQQLEQMSHEDSFPYDYIDSLVERRVPLAALVVMDVNHRTYTGLNKNAPSLGDLPVYLERMRRTCYEDLLFVTISMEPSESPGSLSSVKSELPHERYRHKNDFLLTGFTDTVLRIVAEGVSGGPRRYIERADEVYNVNRAAVRQEAHTSEGALQALRHVVELEKERQRRSGSSGSGNGSRPGPHPHGSGISNGPTEDYLLQEDGLSFVSSTNLKQNQGSSPSVPPACQKLISPWTACTLSTYHDCRFFLSSTFLDMNNERNALVLDVFPRLRRWCAETGLHVNIIDVDLRWGITEDATSANLSVSVCLNEVSRCAPFFLGMLGSRYGYCPSTLYHQVDDDVDEKDFFWLGQLPNNNDGHLSVTEMEMRHAIYNAERRTGRTKPITMAFFIRDQDALIESLPPNQKGAYTPDTPTTMQAIEKLAGYVQSKGAPTIPYTARYLHNPDQFKTMGSVKTFDMPCNFVSSLSTSLPFSSLSKNATSVPLDMTDFSRKALMALKAIIKRQCYGEDMESEDDDDDDDDDEDHEGFDIQKRVKVTASVLPTDPTWTGSPAGAFHEQTDGSLYVKEYMNQVRFTSTLLNTFVPPIGVVEQLSLFALTGQAPTATNTEASTGTCIGGNNELNAPCVNMVGGNNEDSDDNVEHDEEMRLDSAVAVTAMSNVLVVEDTEGNGKSSVSAAVAARVSNLEESNVMVLHFACQASDRSVRCLAYFLAFSLVYRLGLQEDFRISESDSATTILQFLPCIYTAARKRKSICVFLDGLEKSPYASELLNSLAWLIPPGPTPEIRFIVTTTPNSSFGAALKSRVPPAWVTQLPDLGPLERAQLVRSHLAAYGKRLQESFRANELRMLLRKRDANRASYLTLAILYLRLFCTFDTLREDIQRLPQLLSQLYVEVYRQLENRFDEAICRDVLIVLYLSNEIGGITEFNLYRLVGNVASASRLVTLLTGTCLRVTRGRVIIPNAAFATSIATRYLPRVTDMTDACANILAAELHFSPLVTYRDRQTVRSKISIAIDAIKSVAVNKSVFRPTRYSARQLLNILYFAFRARQYDALAVLASYLPLLENLLINATYLQRFMNLLSQATLANTVLAQRLGPVLSFFEDAYPVISDRPSLLRQCVRNARVHSALHGAKRSVGEDHWVEWTNRAQHGKESCRPFAFPTTEPLQCLALSDDGQFVAGGGSDFIARVVRFGVKDQITVTLNHAAAVTAIAFLPQRPYILVTGCERGVLRVWSLEDNSLLQQGLFHRRRIASISCHPLDVGMVCSGSFDASCALWRIGRNITDAMALFPQAHIKPLEVLRHHQAAVACVAYHNSGDILATGSWERRVCFISVKRRFEEKEEPHSNVALLASSVLPNSSHGSHSMPSCVMYEHRDFWTDSPVRALAFTPSMVVTCAVGLYDGDICLYDFAAATCNARLSMHVGVPITSIAFSPDAKLMASANARGEVRVSYAGVAGTSACALNAHRNAVTSLSFHPTRPTTLFTAALDREIKEWSVDSAMNSVAARGVHATRVSACAAASDGSFFVTCGIDGTGVFFGPPDRSGFIDMDSAGSFVPQFTLPHEQQRITYVCIGLKNKRILCGTGGGEVFVWAAAPGLNRREGRLLQRVRVTEETGGMYPVVCITCDVRACTQEQSNIGEKMRMDSLANSISRAHFSHTTRDAAVDSMMCAKAVALTTNGIMAAWELHNDDTKLSMRGIVLRMSERDTENTNTSSNGVVSDETQVERRRLTWMSPPSSYARTMGGDDGDGDGDGHSPCGGTEGLECGGEKNKNNEKSMTLECKKTRSAMTSCSLANNSLPFSEGLYNGAIAKDIPDERIPVKIRTAAVNAYGEEITAAVALPMELHPHDSPHVLLSGVFVAIGQRHCFLVSAAASAVMPLSLSHSDAVPPLRHREIFISASNGVYLTENPALGHATHVLFALGTSCGFVLLVEAICDAHSGDMPTGHSAAEFMSHIWKHVRLIVRHRFTLASRNGRIVPIEAIALTACASDVPLMNSGGFIGDRCIYRDTTTALRLVVGDRDGSTRLFQIFPFRESAAVSAMALSHGGESVSECGYFLPTSPTSCVAFLRTWIPHCGKEKERKGNDNGAMGSGCDAWVAGDVLGNVYQLRLAIHRTDHKTPTHTNINNSSTAISIAVPSLTRTRTTRRISGRTAASSPIGLSLGCDHNADKCTEVHGMDAEKAEERDTEKLNDNTVEMNAQLNRRAERRRITHLFAQDETPRDGPVESFVPNGKPSATGVPPYEIILQRAPPPGLDTVQRREWFRYRQELLADALQAGRRAAKAREVLAAYSRDALLQLGIQLEKQ